ncbi:hypothetical protein MKK68_20040 [Methylobacterium sp. E-016]|uniref:hypothetical protein n=1 Tax=Methylobacterium sp. E-016 TaxID=2836556 RepID=UPI001FBB8B3C|nr:hypothetical protein [Methylobacterium sp. E-016]MCJ2077905.1 hypothetical protein [Methylobacterium sp. E-016]
MPDFAGFSAGISTREPFYALASYLSESSALAPRLSSTVTSLPPVFRAWCTSSTAQPQWSAI